MQICSYIGGLSGSIGAFIANPADLIKVRMQASSTNPSSTLPTILSSLISIMQKEGGFFALYRGVTPTVYRAGVLTASQLSTYDHTKHTLLSYNSSYFHENMITHIISSIVAGFVCATTTAPIDTIKSRYMTQKVDEVGKGVSYTSISDCVKKTWKYEGLKGL